jgi:hypothetical protein
MVRATMALSVILIATVVVLFVFWQRTMAVWALFIHALGRKVQVKRTFSIISTSTDQFLISNETHRLGTPFDVQG